MELSLWHRIQDSFAKSLELPTLARETIKEQLLHEYPHAQREILTLFENLDASFQEMATEIESSDGASAQKVRLGGFIGPYQLKRELGQGGMGVVYLAEQFAPIHREVALKLIRSESSGSRAVRMFEQERQSLALMNHPAIATVFEAGQSESGFPYLVMEYVSGMPIHKFCSHYKLDLWARIRLFLDVAEGMRHAHQKGLIHRDIKPGNIMVKRQDGQDLPKIIDFGLARLFDPEAGGLLGTHAGMQGTPAYMSPEQIAGEGIDTRTDVYALTLVLYQLLTGGLPYEQSNTGVSEILRRVLLLHEKPFLRASQKIQSLPDAKAISEELGFEPARLLRLLRRDLDWILDKGLRALPDQRYDSIGALIADLRRFLNGEPVEATPKSRTYLWRKWVVRHKIIVAAASVALFALIGGGSVAAIGWRRALQARKLADLNFQRALKAGEEARRETEKAKAINRFLEEMFDAAQPEFMGRDVKVTQVLDHAVQRLDREFVAQPEVRVGLMTTIGKTYLEVGELEKGQRLLESAFQSAQQTLGRDNLQSLEAEFELSQSQSRSNDGAQLEQAIKRQLQILHRLEQIGAKESELAFNLQLQLGLNLFSTAKREESLPYFQSSYEGRSRLFGSDHKETLEALLDGTLARRKIGYKAGSLQTIRTLLEKFRLTLGDTHPITLNAIVNLGDIEIESGNFTAADSLLSENARYSATRFGEKHANFFIAKGMLTKVLRGEERLLEAVANGENLLQAAKQLDDLNLYWLIVAKRDLAYALSQLGRYREANQIVEEYLREFQLTQPNRAIPIKIGHIFRYTNLYRWQRENPSIQLSQPPPIDLVDFKRNANSAAEIHLVALEFAREWDPKGAKSLILPLLDQLDPNEPEWLKLRILLAKIQLNLREYSETERLFAPIVAAPLRGEWEDRELLISALALYGKALQLQGKDALPALERAWSRSLSRFAQEDGRPIQIGQDYARELLKQSKIPQARQILSEVQRRARICLNQNDVNNINRQLQQLK